MRATTSVKDIVLMFVCGALVACSDSPDRLAPEVPIGIPAGPAAFYKTDWGACAISVFTISEAFAERLAADPQAVLGDQLDKRYTQWKPTPVSNENAGTYARSSISASRQCLEASPTWLKLFDEAVNGRDAFFAETRLGGVAVIDPALGMLFYAGHD